MVLIHLKENVFLYNLYNSFKITRVTYEKYNSTDEARMNNPIKRILTNYEA